jgi:Domain of unknown function (DUF4185)
MSFVNLRKALPTSLLLLLVFIAAEGSEPVYHSGTTRKILQITGETDTPLRRPTLSRTVSQAGVLGTDLGHSFEHNGKLVFLFGDTAGRPGWVMDCLAFSSSTEPTALEVTFPTDADGKFHPIKVEGVPWGPMEVPTGGISINGIMYVALSAGWNKNANNLERSVLARSDDDGLTWTKLYNLSEATNHDIDKARFLVVDMVEVEAAAFPRQLPYDSGKVVLIWGTGAYRKSNPCLACIPSVSIEDKSALRYFSGLESGVPTWNESESRAVFLFLDPQIGEFSIEWIEPVERWVMLYNSMIPLGISMRTSKMPWGPFSEREHVLDPFRDGACGTYLHVPWNMRRSDAFQDPLQKNKPGAVYGPYLIKRFTTGNSRRCQLYYTLSTWNPYQTVLMRTEIGEPLTVPPMEKSTLTLIPGCAHWKRSADDFYKTTKRSDKTYLTTSTAEGSASMGITWRWLPRDDYNSALRFSVSGGQSEVILIEGGSDIPVDKDIKSLYNEIKRGDYGDVVYCTWGHSSNKIEVPIEWLLAPFDSANLKVVVIDHLDISWGFITVSEMRLERREPIAGDTK